MKTVTGKFNGTGAAVFIACGFVPTRVIVRAPGDAGTYRPSISFDVNETVAAQSEGVLDTDGATQLIQLGYGEGISVYEGGDILTSDMQTTTAYGEGVYLVPDGTDYRFGTGALPGGGNGDAVADTIDKWAIDVLATRKGHFNEDVTGTYIGVGSEILIDTGSSRIKWTKAFIELLTAGQGEAASEVTLSRQIGSGEIRKIKGKFGHKPQTVGEHTQAGFKLSATSVVNVNDELNTFIAILDGE
jgi:hypothetical protein